jgi:voltage-gated potassium channel
MYVIFSGAARRFYTRISGLTWDTVLGMLVCHFAVSWGLMILIGGETIASRDIFWYFYVTTATTVGYGDYSPVTETGRLVTTLWIMPGGIALFTAIIAKFAQQIVDRWRRRLLGLASYENLTDHIVILGWHGSRTHRMVDQIRGGEVNNKHEIVLCSRSTEENPMPDRVRFVKGLTLNAPDLLRRAAVKNANYIIALGHDDDETLAAVLGAAAVNSNAHIVAYFDQQSFADLLKAHCPHAECNVSLSIELMVRSAQDPGSSRVQSQLLSTVKGPTQYSLQVPDDAKPVAYGALFSALKTSYDATLIGVAETALGDDLVLNAPQEHRVDPGMIVYFMAPHRIDPSQIDWSALGATQAT